MCTSAPGYIASKTYCNRSGHGITRQVKQKINILRLTAAVGWMQLVGSPWQLQLQQITRVPAVHLHNSPPKVGYVTYLELAVVQSTLPHMKENVRSFNWIRHVKRLAMSLSQFNKAQQTKLFLLIEKRKFWARLKQDWRCRKSMYDHR